MSKFLLLNSLLLTAACGRIGFDGLAPVEQANSVDANVDSDAVSMPRFTALYMTDWGTDSIERISLDGSVRETIAVRAVPVNVALHHSAQHVYWVEQSLHLIQRADLDGMSQQDSIVSNVANPMDLALDQIGGKVYWCSVNPGRIQRANLDGTDEESFAYTTTSPWGIAFDPIDRRPYWTDISGPDAGIWRLAGDGTTAERIVSGDVKQPTGIAIDPVGRTVYWTDKNAAQILRANLDGTGVETLLDQAQGLVDPLRLTLDTGQGHIYWTDGGTNTVNRADLDGTNLVEIVTTGLSRPEGIALSL